MENLFFFFPFGENSPALEPIFLPEKNPISAIFLAWEAGRGRNSHFPLGKIREFWDFPFISGQKSKRGKKGKGTQGISRELFHGQGKFPFSLCSPAAVFDHFPPKTLFPGNSFSRDGNSGWKRPQLRGFALGRDFGANSLFLAVFPGISPGQIRFSQREFMENLKSRPRLPPPAEIGLEPQFLGFFKGKTGIKHLK